MTKPRETNFTADFSGLHAYLVDEFMEYPFIYGRNRINTVETVVRTELDRIYRKGEGGLTREQRRDLRSFGGAQKILTDAIRERYVPGFFEECEDVKSEPVANLRLKAFSLRLNFGGVPAFMIDKLISKRRYDGSAAELARNLVESYFTENKDFISNFQEITLDEAKRMRYIK